MSSEPQNPAVDVLTRSQRGGVSFKEISSVLALLDGMHLMVSQADSQRMLDDLDEQLIKNGYGNVKAGGGLTPKILGVTTDDGGFLPRVFTSSEVMHEYAVSSGKIEPGTTYLSSKRSWVSGLVNFLAQGFAGVVFDQGSDHEVTFDRTGLMHLVSQMTLEDLARQEFIYAVTFGNKVYFQSGDEGDKSGTWAFAYDEESTAAQGLAELRKHDPRFETVAVAPASFLKGILGRDTSRLTINGNFTHERAYTRNDIVRMLEIAESSQSDKTKTSPESANTPSAQLDPALNPDATQGSTAEASQEPLADFAGRPLWEQARTGPPPALTPRPGREGAAARGRLLEIKRLGDDGVDQPWELSEHLAFDLDLCVATNPRKIEGRPWPLLYQDRDTRTGQDVRITHLYSTEDAMRAELSSAPEDQRNYQVVAGVEAFRWIWSCPETIAEIFIDHPDPAGWVSFPQTWIVPMLFPTFLSVPDLTAVEAVPLARLGGLPRVAGLEPRALRALVKGWKQLLGPPQSNEVEFAAVEHSGGRYLPIYSDAEQFFDWSRSGQGEATTPEAAGDEPAFESWLVRARDVDGAVLDPASPSPLTLDHTDLLFLSMWSKTGVQPSGMQLASQLGALLRAGHVAAHIAGRIAADWPSYFVGTLNQNGQNSLIMVPGTDDMAVFTNDQHFNDFVGTYRMAGMITGEVNQVQVVSRWQASVFRGATDMFSGAWIDPTALDMDSGLRLDGTGLDAALARLEYRLRPRVAGFGAGA